MFISCTMKPSSCNISGGKVLSHICLPPKKDLLVFFSHTLHGEVVILLCKALLRVKTFCRTLFDDFARRWVIFVAQNTLAWQILLCSIKIYHANSFFYWWIKNLGLFSYFQIKKVTLMIFFILYLYYIFNWYVIHM